jgi:hypothetical protein
MSADLLLPASAPRPPAIERYVLRIGSTEHWLRAVRIESIAEIFFDAADSGAVDPLDPLFGDLSRDLAACEAGHAAPGESLAASTPQRSRRRSHRRSSRAAFYSPSERQRLRSLPFR